MVGPTQTMLGLVINTIKLIVAIPKKYVIELRLQELINITWHVHCCAFTVQEAQQLTDKLCHLAEGATWVFNLLTHLYTSIVLALT